MRYGRNKSGSNPIGKAVFDELRQAERHIRRAIEVVAAGRRASRSEGVETKRCMVHAQRDLEQCLDAVLLVREPEVVVEKPAEPKSNPKVKRPAPPAVSAEEPATDLAKAGLPDADVETV